MIDFFLRYCLKYCFTLLFNVHFAGNTVTVRTDLDWEPSELAQSQYSTEGRALWQAGLWHPEVDAGKGSQAEFIDQCEWRARGAPSDVHSRQEISGGIPERNFQVVPSWPMDTGPREAPRIRCSDRWCFLGCVIELILLFLSCVKLILKIVFVSHWLTGKPDATSSRMGTKRDTGWISSWKMQLPKLRKGVGIDSID